MPPTPTNTTTHTPGPWSYIEDAGSSSFCYEIRAARPLNGPRGIALVYSDTGTDVPTPEDTANAARIVACVNACAGMNDPAADLAAIRAALIDARDRLAGMTGVPNPLASVRAALSLLGDDAPRPATEPHKRTRIGTRDTCAACDMDVEYHGRAGWIDRGGNGYCDTSGAALYDGDGCPVKLPHKRHRPTP